LQVNDVWLEGSDLPHKIDHHPALLEDLPDSGFIKKASLDGSV
jgi:hypothetical protein